MNEQNEILENDTEESIDNVIKFNNSSIEETDESDVAKEPSVEEVLNSSTMSVDQKLKFLLTKSEELSKRIINDPYYLDLSSLNMNNVSKYITDLLTFVKTKLTWTGTDFIYVELINKEFENLKKTYSNGPIGLTGSTVSAFYQLQMACGGEGYKDIKKKKYLLEPFKIPYRQLVDDNETYKQWGEEYQRLLEQKDEEERIKFEESQASKQTEEKEKPLIDIPRTLDDIVRIMNDMNSVLSDIKEQQEKQNSN